MAAKVEIYTWSSCPFCIRAKALLKKKGVEFTEYCIDGDEEARAKMSDRANGRTSVPQI
ncbi:MAG: glutaredoxin, partial [Chroococcales cyanobacterium metabat2.561]